jgi:hypothetical protein
MFTSFDEQRRATPVCLCVACHWQIQRAGLAIVLVVDDGKPLVNITFCLHAACEAAFREKHPPTRGARWVTFPLTAYLTTLLKNTSAIEGAGQPLPLGH